MVERQVQFLSLAVLDALSGVKDNVTCARTKASKKKNSHGNTSLHAQ